MPPEIIYDLNTIDPDHVEFDLEDIRSINPQRFEFEQLTGVNKFLEEEEIIIGFKETRADEFWVRGHIPGNPVLPGVLMVEAAAQLCSFFQTKFFKEKKFFGFGGINNVKFRGTVKPGDRLIIICKGKRLRPRVSHFYCQGVVGDSLVFEGEITGICMDG